MINNLGGRGQTDVKWVWLSLLFMAYFIVYCYVYCLINQSLLKLESYAVCQFWQWNCSIESEQWLTKYTQTIA